MKFSHPLCVAVLVLGLLALRAYAADPATKPVENMAAVFAPTPTIRLAGQHDFGDPASINSDSATQLKGLCAVDDFRALPEADRHVYSFDPWPGEKDALGLKQYAFSFDLGTIGVTRQKIAFTPTGGGPGGVKGLVRSVDPATKKPVLAGFGNLDWSGNLVHTYRFDKPLTAFAVVLKSPGDIDLRRMFWASNTDNGFPLSYTLADGSVINLGAREISGAILKADQNNFVGVMDRSGTGIVSVTFTLKGLAGNKAQPIAMTHMAFATQPKPAVASIINLKSSSDFIAPYSIAAAPDNAAAGLTTLDTFRDIVGNHRYVYRFDTWPDHKAAGGAGGDALAFDFDLKGKGVSGQKVTLRTVAADATRSAQVTQADGENALGEPVKVLRIVGPLDRQGTLTQTLEFTQPVWSAGLTYRSGKDVKIGQLTYVHPDGTQTKFSSPGTITAGKTTFVGVRDTTNKGIASIAIELTGTAADAQPIEVHDLAFAIAGPPPGEWKLVMEDHFDGDELNPKYWSTGYRFVDVINNELQAFVPENVVVKDGVCTIKVEHREARNTDWNGQSKARQQFASGAFISANKFTQTYGYFEARIKMPKARGAGIWPAFWMLPDRGPQYTSDAVRYGYRTAKYGTGIEIDIFEFMPRWKKADGTFPVHVGCIWSYAPVSAKDPAPHGYGAYALTNDGWGPAELTFPNLDTEFHTYGLYWSPERIIWYIDGKPIFRVKDPKHVPDVPHYFLFNVSVHQNGWGKSPDKSNPKMAEIIEDMPNAMEIDYFRAYSGALEEPIPASPTDIPGEPRKYPVPSAADAAPNQTPTTPAPTTAPSDAPAAPVNSTINTPAAG